MRYRLMQAKMRGFPLTLNQFQGPTLNAEGNGALLLARADLNLTTGLDLYQNPTPSQVPAAKAAISAAAPYFVFVEKACAAGNFRYRESSDIGDGFQDQANLRKAVRNLCIRAQIKAIENDGQGALQDVERALILTNYPLIRSAMIDCLVSTAMHAIVSVRCEQLASLWADKPALLHELERVLTSHYKPIDARRLVAQDFFVTSQNFNGGSGRSTSRQKRQIRAIRSLMLAEALKRYDLLSRSPREPWQLKKILSAWDVNENRSLARARRGFGENISEITNPVFAQAYDALGKREAMQRCLVSLIRCLIYKNKNGRLESNLRIMNAEARDPFSSSSLRLKLDGAAIRIYSFGPTRIDHGGRTRFETSDNFNCDVVMGNPPANQRRPKSP